MAENENDDDLELYDSRSSKFGKGKGKGKLTARQQAIQGEDDENVPYHEVEYLHDVPLGLIVEIGQTEKTIREVLALKKGAILEFTKQVGEPMDITVGHRLMARGEIVVVNERYGIRISEVTRPEEGDNDAEPSFG
ncbi:MAG: flagellar motor switch protein FliN/FliY [bacterium]|jgi:flagellar motor switch protein FliN/FliY